MTEFISFGLGIGILYGLQELNFNQVQVMRFELCVILLYVERLQMVITIRFYLPDRLFILRKILSSLLQIYNDLYCDRFLFFLH